MITKKVSKYWQMSPGDKTTPSWKLLAEVIQVPSELLKSVIQEKNFVHISNELCRKYYRFKKSEAKNVDPYVFLW